MLRTCLLILTATLSALAADVAGTWKGSAEGPNGQMERTFTFKVDGDKLSGETVSSFVGKSEIRQGVVKGDELSFVITIKFQDNEMEVNYKGKLVGNDEMKLTAEVQGNQIDWVAKRTQ
ncbi:MAG: hypothetical protein R2762_11335 [Bryobacteraceae bacterium]